MRANHRCRTGFLCAALMLPPTLAVGAERLSYNRDIRPILVENCLSCHGADSASRKADLRLDLRDAAIAAGAIVPGDPDSSPMLDRIHSSDLDEVMPPPATKKTLSAKQKELLARWIAAGAEYEPHWSFIPPRRPDLPAVRNESWVRTPIDRFILARLELEGLDPAPEADRRTLARRVALDLTGLPPAPTVVEEFVADQRPDAYERLVDALLATPAWGEHRGRYWLDYARYADTHGIHMDYYREMWSYRQWIIDAFNANMPFDEFTVRQLAGDLLPAAGPEERLANQIASGFNRCNMTTNEGGTIPEEYLVLYTRDRTETTSTVWLGLTTGCAVCHDHKFDPLSQREFYELAAFFNNTTQKALDGNVKDTPPVVVVPQPAERTRFREVEGLLADAKAVVKGRQDRGHADFDAWVTDLTAEQVRNLSLEETPLVALPLVEGAGNATQAEVSGEQVAIALSETTTWEHGPMYRQAVRLQGGALELPTAGDFEHDQPFSVSFWIKPSSTETSGQLLARMDADTGRGWEVRLDGRRLTLQLVHDAASHALKVATRDQLQPDVWTFATVTHGGSGTAEGVRFFFDGKQQPINALTESLGKNTIRTAAPLVLGAVGNDVPGPAIADLRLWDRDLAADEVERLRVVNALTTILTQPAPARVKSAARLYDWWLATIDPAFKAATADVQRLDKERAAIGKRGTVAHVMSERDQPAMAFILDRGEYDKRTKEVFPETPGILPPFPADLPRNRLGFARWLFLAEHPLTARVTVNRFWQEVFGTGLVRTSGDFGTTGELPSHPELLDWLASEFRGRSWDVKQFFRLLVTSAAYRQAATATGEKLAADAANRLLSRGPRFRMDAEMLRDQALATSGLLVRRPGGPSVKPYQPDGVWEAVSMGGDTSRYKRDAGDAVYRRSMYSFWKRTAPPASLDIFNAPSRETCCVKRERTNTPLQALVTLNDPQFVEAARVLAGQALAASSDEDARIDVLARRILARPFTADELSIVKRSRVALSAWYADHPADAGRLVKVVDAPATWTDTAQLAAWTMLANQLMNLDEFLCK
ncbi:MAG: DUF1553 domain-containing protein [Planctomycetia bacterium]